jgi:PAS domain S-box-containing protein
MSQNNVTVLLVEDSPSDALLLEQALSKASVGQSMFKVVCVETLADCLSNLQGVKADVILLDLQLPDSSGLATFVKLQAQSGRLPIIVLTGLNDHESAMQSLKSGAEDYIVKGNIDGDSLARALLFAIERKQIQAQVSIQLKITKILAESASIAECSTKVIASICEWLHWDFGAFWIVDDAAATIRCESVYTSPDASVDGFRAASRASTFTNGNGVPGRVWASGQTLYVADIAHETSSPRALQAKECELKSGIAFPIKFGDKTLGVIEFFSHTLQQLADGLPELFEGISLQIGQFLSRKQSEQAQSRLASIVESCDNAIIGKTLDGVIETWNAGAERIYGYSADEVVGKSVAIIFTPENAGTLPVLLNKASQSAHHFEAEHVCKNGERIHISASLSPIIGLNGEVVGLSSIARDVTEQKRSANNLRESSERLSMAVSAAQIGIWDWDLQTALRWDSGMYRLFGLSEGDFHPSFEGFLECVAAEEREIVRQTFKRAALTHRYHELDFHIVRPDGSRRFIQSSGSVKCDDNGGSPRLTGVCIDATERRRIESELRESDQRLNLALDFAKMGVWESDLIANSVWRSLKHDQIFGYESMEQEWNTEKFLKHVVPEDRAMARETIEAGIVDDQFSLECRIIHAQHKSIRWISAQGRRLKDVHDRPVKMIGTIVDITERKQLELLAADGMKRKDKITDAIVQNAPIGIVIVDADSRVTNANAALCSMIARDLEQVLSQPLAAVMPEQLFTPVQESIMSGKQIQVSRQQIVTADGRQVYWDLSVWPVAVNANVTGAVLLLTDSTHTVLLEQQRDDFVASVAHDIKNPLIGAVKLLDSLCRNSLDMSPQELARTAVVLRDSNQSLLSLVQNLVDVYRFDTLAYPCQYENLDLRMLVTSCIRQIRHVAENHKVTLNSTIPGSVLIQADSIAIRRVLMNLLHNAIKFNKPGGTVEVTVEQLEDFVRLSVRDTGIGISVSDQQKLFQRYQQGNAGKSYTGGTGLGLFLCRKIVEGHQGRITCESELDSGANFIIKLPVNQPPTTNHQLPIEEKKVLDVH